MKRKKSYLKQSAIAVLISLAAALAIFWHPASSKQVEAMVNEQSLTVQRARDFFIERAITALLPAREP